ncbi:MAG: hypothetical protein JW842_04390 [Prolixibacteraceae bacterium]|nr:hypothetical protein [Prolixibacteraceae bacterium]
MKRSSELEFIFDDLFAFIKMLIQNYGEPVRSCEETIEELKTKIAKQPTNGSDVHLSQPFFLVERVAGDILFSHNLNRYIGINGDVDLMTFHSFIDDGSQDWSYLKDYLSWGKAAYLFFANVGKKHDMHKFAMKVALPMRFKDGRIYWVAQETRPLEIDSDKNMLSHLNTYTVIGLYKEKKPVDLVAEVYYDNSYHDDWNLMLSESRYAIKPFNVSSVQQEILQHYRKNKDATTISCANTLKYPRNTIKKYISDCKNENGILNIARASFPHITFKSITDVVTFLDKIGWFKRL